MRGLVYCGKGDIRYEDSHPEPQLRCPSDVKIKVAYCGICGTDLHEYLDGPNFFDGSRNVISNLPKKKQCMGHEMSGEIVEVGQEVKNLKVGDKVAVEATGTCIDRYRFPDSPHFSKPPCASCSQGCYNSCNYVAFSGLGFEDGGFAEYCVIGAHHAVPYPGDLIPEDVAALTEPISVAWHAVRKSGIGKGGSALILGSGPIGLATILSLKGHRVEKIVVVEPSKARRELAELLNVESFDPTGRSIDETTDEVRKSTESGFGFTHSYDCSGVPDTFAMSFHGLNSNGIATNIAIWAHRPVQFYPMEVTLHEKLLTGSMGYTRKDFEQVIDAYKAGYIHPNEVKKLITHIAPLEKGVDDGIKELIEHKNRHIKILITPRPC